MADSIQLCAPCRREDAKYQVAYAAFAAQKHTCVGKTVLPVFTGLHKEVESRCFSCGTAEMRKPQNISCMIQMKLPGKW